MTLTEMHVWFRQYAQQMGMQNVRAILPEQIDLLLNTSITDIVTQYIKENISITNDRIITDNSKLGQINAFRTLYNVSLIDMSPIAPTNKETRAFNFSVTDRMSGRMTTSFNRIDDTKFIPDYMFLVDFSINYKKVVDKLGYVGIDNVFNRGDYSVLTPEGAVQRTDDFLTSASASQPVTVKTFITDTEEYIDLTFEVDDATAEKPKLICTSEAYKGKYLAVENIKETDSQYEEKRYVLTTDFVDGSIGRSKSVLYNPLVIHVSSYVQPTFDPEGLETNYFPVRIIDDAFLADTLNDFILKNRLRSPIIVTYNNNSNSIFDIYIDEFHKVTTSNGRIRYVLDNDLVPYKLRISYIAKPAEVKYREDMGKDNIECDLPDYMHVDIVKHAVDLYRATISGSLLAAQNQEQAARQESMRNNYRNENNQQQY